MDAAYIVRPTCSQNHEALRYSVRSLINVTNFDSAVDRVWIIGTRPDWITNIEYIDGNKHGSKGQNIFHNWLTFAQHPDAPDEFIAFNDDITALWPVEASANEWQEPLRDRLARERNPHGWWARSLKATLAHCETLTTNPKSFELHRPVVMNREQLRIALNDALNDAPNNGEPPQWRSTYGNHWNTGTTKVFDVKIKTPTAGPSSQLWVSTNPASWNGKCGQHIRALFPEPSSYETT